MDKDMLINKSDKKLESVQFSCSLSRVRLFAIPWIAVCQASMSITNSQSSLKLTSIESLYIYRVGDAIQPSHPLSSPFPPARNPSQHQDLSQWVNSSHEVAKVLEFQLQHQSFQRTPRMVFSFRMDWLDLLSVQGTLKNLLQHHSSNASKKLSGFHKNTLVSMFWVTLSTY